MPLFRKTFAAMIAAAAGLAVCARGETFVAEPDAFIEYIEATGSQYIDTGVNAETGLKAQIDFAWAEYSGNVDWSLLDATDPITSTSEDRSRIFMCHMYNNKPFFGYGKGSRGNPSGSVAFVPGQRCEIITDMTDPDSLELVQNGTNTFSDADRMKYGTNGVVNLGKNLFVSCLTPKAIPTEDITCADGAATIFVLASAGKFVKVLIGVTAQSCSGE